MKSKNLFLGAAATMFAVAGAVASSFITANYAQVPTGPGGSIQCRQIEQRECGSGGTNVCKAIVAGVPGGPYNLYQTKLNATTCSNLITTSPFVNGLVEETEIID